MFKKLFLCLGLLGIAAQASTPDGYALADAIRNNDIAAVKSMLGWLQENPKGRFNELFGYCISPSPLQVAAKEGNKEALDCLMQGLNEAGFNSSWYARDRWGGFCSLLYDAAEGGNTDIMDEMFSRLSEKELQNVIKDNFGGPLMSVARGGHVEAVEWVFQKGADINKIDVPTFIENSKNIAVVETLFKHFQDQGENQKFFTSVGRYNNADAFMAAAMNTRAEDDIFMWLVQEAGNNGIDLKEILTNENKEGQSIIFFVAANHNSEILKYVLDSIPANKSKEVLSSAMMKIVEYVPYYDTPYIEENKALNDFMWLVQEAKNNGIDPEKYISAKNASGENILFCAVKNENLDIVKYLLESLSVEKCLEMINATDNDGKTALEISKDSDRPDIEQLLEGYNSKHSE